MSDEGKPRDKGDKETLKDWLKGDDRGLVSWLTTDGKRGAVPASDELFQVKKRNLQLEDELALLRKQLEEARKGVVAPPHNIDEMLAARPSLRSQIDRYQSQLESLSAKIKDTVPDFPPEVQEFIDIYEILNKRSQILREILNGMLEKPDLLEDYSELLVKRGAEMSEVYRTSISRIEDLYGALQRKKLEEQLSTAPATDAMGEEQADKEFLILKKENERLHLLLNQKDEESEKLRSLLRYKEEELVRREDDLMYRERLMEEARRKFDNERKSLEGLDAVAMEKRLEHLRGEIQRKEEELRHKEKYLASKMDELRNMELGLIEEEIDLRDEERKKEITLSKVHTGNQRFNDLLLGGYPFGSNIILHGPAFVGKEVLLAEFMAEGLKKGVPVLWVITDKTCDDIRKLMEPVLPGYMEYEKLNLVKYVDSYSRSIGDLNEDPNTVYVKDPADHAALSKAVDEITAEFLKDHDYYRLGFQSLSTFIAYSDSASAFRFLSPFVGKRRKSKAVCLYLLEKGMHNEQDIQMLSMMMDGIVDFNVDQMRTFLTVTGVGDVQTRGNVRYNWSNHGLSIGSFTLDHIK
jgi:KaiC/GvpD/RAD55 family RecA-like ATPase